MTHALSVVLILVPLVLLGFTALYLLRLAMAAGEMTDAARQRLAGLGMLLLIAVILVSLGAIAAGFLGLSLKP